MTEPDHPKFETGTTSALDRMDLTGRLTRQLIPLLEDHGFKIHEYGQHVILQQHTRILSRFRKLNSKLSNEVLMLKFSPDYLSAFPPKNNFLFLLDAKASITPVFFQAYIDTVRQSCGLAALFREDIGEVEREAWDNYNQRYPKDHVAICFACPYHPRLLVCEWVSKMTPLYRLAMDRNTAAGGSGTPHVNIHLGKMRTLGAFVSEEFGVALDEQRYSVLLEFIKTWPLNKPAGRVNWVQFNNVVAALQKSCPWIKGRWPDNHPRANDNKLPFTE